MALVGSTKHESHIDRARLGISTVIGVCLVAIVGAMALVGIGGNRISATIDEPVDVASFNVFLESGWYVHPGVNLEDPPRDAASNVFVYGPATYSLAHTAFLFIGNAGVDSASLSPDEQQMRKAVLLGLLGLAVAAMAWTMTLVTRRIWVGFVAGAFLIALPIFSGHAMFNMKDFPPAAGLVMLVAGCVGLSDSSTHQKESKSVVGIALISIGVFVSVGTRPAFILIVGVVIATTVATSWLVDFKSGRSLNVRAPIGLLAGLGSGYVLLYFLYPNLFGRPISLLGGALGQASGFPWGGVTLTAGALAPNRPGLLYVFQWMGVQLPIVVIVLALLGAFWSLRLWFRCLLSRRSQGCANDRLGLIGSALWLIVFVGILAAVVVSNPVLYNGMRQFLFLFPAVVFLATLGLWRAAQFIQCRWSRSWAAALVAACLVAGVAVPAIGQLRLFPYAYTGLNVLTMPAGIDGRWETDYWGVSSGELRRTAYAAKAEGFLPSSFYYPPDYCDEASYSGRWKETGGPSDSLVDGEAFYFCQVRTWGRNTPPEGCSVGWAVQRPQLWRQSTMSLIAKCPFAAAEIPETGIDFAVHSQDGKLKSPAEPFLLWGWQISPELGIYSNSDSVGLGIKVPAAMRMKDLQLDLDLKSDFPSGVPLSVMIRANGEPIADVEFDEQSKQQDLQLSIPAAVIDQGENDLLVIRIDQTDGEGEPMFVFPQKLTLRDI